MPEFESCSRARCYHTVTGQQARDRRNREHQCVPPPAVGGDAERPPEAEMPEPDAEQRHAGGNVRRADTTAIVARNRESTRRFISTLTSGCHTQRGDRKRPRQGHTSKVDKCGAVGRGM